MPGQPLLMLTILYLGQITPSAGSEVNVALASQGGARIK